MGEVDRYTSISDSPNSEPGFWEAERPLHSDGGGPHFIPFILHIYTHSRTRRKTVAGKVALFQIRNATR